MEYKRILVTGGSGFIGSAFIRWVLSHISRCEKIVNLDLLTYAANQDNLRTVASDPRYLFVKGDIRNEALVQTLCEQHSIEAIVHCAAESHVDRSIADPTVFLETNVKGTLSLLQVVRRLKHIHFHHVSTDEVYGSLPETGQFTEQSPYRPNSPYAASKAASDHFVRAYSHTYDLSTTMSHCSNNYGPHQFAEKFIPHMITSCLKKKPLTVYGNGRNIRDWLYVDDHAEALWTILCHGKKGQSYGISGQCEKRNIDLLHILIDQIALLKQEDPAIYRALITHVPDRPGHDLRYAIDSSKIKTELGWQPRHNFNDGLHKTISWYIQNVEDSLHHPCATQLV
jgi:dTDP-glucose 4,6-dehydratase